MHLLRQFALIAVSSLTLWAQDPAMLQADAAFASALAKADKPALDRLLDPAFTWTTPQGKVHTRAEALQQLPASPIATAKTPTSTAHTYGDLGNIQLIAGRDVALRVWAKRGTGATAAWKLIVHQELTLLAAPPTFTPGAGKECDNPCKHIDFTPQTETERQVAAAYLKLETAAHARNSAGFAPMVADEFVAASSNGNVIQTKASRIESFNRSKDGGVAPTPLRSARMIPFGQAVLMLSEHTPDKGAPLHVTRIWLKRGAGYVSALSYQTAIAR